MDTLNEYQRAAVEDLSPACVVKANVGSGKTTVLVRKVQYLHEVQKVPFEDMVVLTFTNKAANEMKERLESEQNEMAYFGTFHSVALRLLKEKFAEKLSGWTGDFSVVDPDEELELAQELIAERGLQIKYKNRLKKRIEEEAAAFYAGNVNTRYQDELFTLLSALEEEKKRQNKMSFSDLLRISTELLKKEELREEEGLWPAWILVDEVQDSDRQQLEFLLALKKAGTKFFAVGDPNQVIYSWRGGMETMFYEIKNRFQAVELSLPVNYRSSAEILEAASRFMQNGGALSGNRELSGKILIKNHYDPFQEAIYLAEQIKKLKEEGISYREIGILYRKQIQAEILEKIFQKEKIPYSVSVKKTIKDIPVLDWIIRVLKFSCQREDTFSGESALMNKLYGERKTKKAAKKLLLEGQSGKSALYDRMCGYPVFFDYKIVDKDAEGERWYQYFGLDEYLHPTSRTYQEDKARVLQFFGMLADFCMSKDLTLAAGTSEYLKSASLYGTSVLEANEEDAVQLMTLHASKGLEFSYVFLIGVNQGLLPLPGKTPEAEEEERRLFFVGMTRAKDVLELSYYTNPGQPGVLSGPGWYLKMLPGHLLDWPENRKQEEKTQNLQMLRRAVEEKRRAERTEFEKDYGSGNSEEEVSIEETSQALVNQESQKQESTDLNLNQKGTPEIKKKRKVRHAKYGVGEIQSEDSMMIEVLFDNYGVKSFVKALTVLEFLE